MEQKTENIHHKKIIISQNSKDSRPYSDKKQLFSIGNGSFRSVQSIQEEEFFS